MKITPMNPQKSKQGVALVIVLGLLTLMTLLCVAFAIAMRVERLAARNYSDGVRSRQLVQTALVRTMISIDTNMVGTCYPAWDFWASSGSGPVVSDSLVKGEASNSIPRSLLSPALLGVKPRWVEIQSDGVTRGRIAFLVMNTGGFIDANYAGGRARTNSTSVMELDLSRLIEFGVSGDKAREQRFYAARSNDIRYETSSELNALMRPPSRDVFVNPVENFSTFSFDPDRDEYFDTDAGGNPINLGTPMAQLQKKFWINGITNYPCFTNIALTAYNDAAFMAGYWTPLRDILRDAGMERPDDVAWNIVNWLDTNRIPQSSDAQPWVHTEGGEAVPIVNEILFSDAGGNSSKFQVEIWFPFAPADVKPSDNMAVQLAAWPSNATVTGVGTKLDMFDGVNPPKWSNVVNIANMNYPDNQFLEVPLVVATNAQNIYFLARTVQKINGKTYPLDQAMGGDRTLGHRQYDPTFLPGPGLWVVNDPRSNGQYKRVNGVTPYWQQRPVSEATLGALNNWVEPKYRPYPLPLDPTDRRQGLPIFCKDGLMVTIGEIGYISRSNLDDEQADLRKHWWNTIDLLHHDEGAYLLDHMTIRNTNYPARAQGLVSINSQEPDVLYALFNNMKVGLKQDETLTHGEVLNLAKVIQAQSAGMPFVSFQDMFEPGMQNGGPIGEAIINCVADIPFDEITDKHREDIFRQIVDMITFRQNMFMIVLVGQAVAPRDPTKFLAEQRALATVYRDSYTGRYFLRSFQWIAN